MTHLFAASGVTGTDWIIVGVTFVIFLIINLVFRRFMTRVAHRVARDDGGGRPGRRARDVDERRREDTIIRTFRAIASLVIWLIAILVMLGELNIRPTTLLTGAGAAAVGFGLVFQSLIQDYLGGINIAIDNQARLGDIVGITTSAGVFFGEVEDMNLRVMKLRDLDGAMHVITNSQVIAISNHTYHFGNVMVDVPLSYDTDLELAEALIDEVGNEIFQDPKWGRYLAEPITYYRVDAFEDSSVTMRARGRANSVGMQWMVAGEFRRRLNIVFRERGVPLPTQNVLVRQQPSPVATQKPETFGPQEPGPEAPRPTPDEPDATYPTY